MQANAMAREPVDFAPSGAELQTFRAVQKFVDEVRDVTDEADLQAKVERVVTALGFDYFAIINHVRFGREISRIRLTNYPAEFIAMLREAGLGADPVLRASERSSAGFVWDDIERILPLSANDRRYMDRVRRLGLVRGFTVPASIPGEGIGSCHFALNRDTEFASHIVAAAHTVGAYAYEAARQLLHRRKPKDIAPPVPLTSRQRECLIHVARGKSDGVIGELLGLSARTVNEHIENAKRRYIVATRVQLVVHALYRAEIAYADAEL